MPVLLSKKYLGVSLYLENGNDDTKCKIQQMGPGDTNVGLGSRMTPSGIQDKEVKYRKEQSETFASRFNATKLAIDEAWICYGAIYIPKVMYPCKIMYFHISECMSVTQKATAAFLPSMNFNRNTTRDVIFGPHWYGGIICHHGYARQGAESVCHLLRHLHWNNE